MEHWINLCHSEATDASIPMSKAGNCGLKNSEDEPQEIKKTKRFIMLVKMTESRMIKPKALKI